MYIWGKYKIGPILILTPVEKFCPRTMNPSNTKNIRNIHSIWILGKVKRFQQKWMTQSKVITKRPTREAESPPCWNRVIYLHRVCYPVLLNLYHRDFETYFHHFWDLIRIVCLKTFLWRLYWKVICKCKFC